MRPDEMPDLPMSDVGFEGYGASSEEMRRGFQRIPQKEGEMADTNGDTYVGDPTTFGGILGRPHGWER